MKFEKVKRFRAIELPMPERKTAGAAGYDFVVAETTIIPSYHSQMAKLGQYFEDGCLLTLDSLEEITREHKARPTLVPTGMKCQLDDGYYLELSARSSCPLKHWLVLANGEGIIDSDYYNNISNEGEIFFQFINFGPADIILHKGDIIGQGIIKKYYTTENDAASGERTGGFGSTSNG